jgi:hypothetical protein
MRGFAEILAAGGQPVVSPFHGGTNFGFMGGLLPGHDGALITTATSLDAPLGESGERTDSYRSLKRLATFADAFGHVFANLDPDYQPVTIDPGVPPSTGAKAARGVSVVPLRGTQGRVVFVFAQGNVRQTTLLLDNGVRMPVDLGDQSVGWYLFDVDLQGRGRLDYANLCPVTMLGRSVVLLQGPEKMPVFISVGGAALQEHVPGGKKPLVVEHKGITFVICNQNQIDSTYVDDEAVYVGVGGFDAEGEPLPAPGYAQATVVRDGGEVSSLRVARPASRAGAARARAAGATIDDWEAAPAEAQSTGESPRFATLDGPQTLATCGAGAGYGWYRISIKLGDARKRLVHLPEASDRLHVFVDGEPQHLLGTGPGTSEPPFELKLTKGEHVIVVLADNLGRESEGGDLMQPKGVWGHFYEVKPLRTLKPKTVEGEPVDPFVLRGFIPGLARGQLGETTQASWSFSHARRTPILVDVTGADAAGTFVLNGEPLAYYAGTVGHRRLRLMLDPKGLDSFKRGKNELRFAPNPHQVSPLSDIGRCVKIYECLDAITSGGTWAFAKWEPPNDSRFEQLGRTQARAVRGCPCWWRTTFSVDGDARPLWLDTNGLSKGQVYVNGENIGRYFTARADGRPVGPQTRLYLPADMVRWDEENDLLIFDEHGFEPSKLKIQ